MVGRVGFTKLSYDKIFNLVCGYHDDGIVLSL